jgi:DNA polymerase-3 subunit beta
MKLSCSKDSLKIAIQQAERMTGKNLALPVLGGILLLAEDNSLTLRATNLDLGIEIKIPAKVEKKGITVMPNGVLSGILSSVNDSRVSLELSALNLIITAVNTKSLVKCLPHEDFPTLPILSEGNSFSMSAEKFSDGIKSVWYSASLSDIKPEIASVYIYPDEENITFVATDSFRLAEKKIPMKKNVAFSHILIPQKNVSEIMRVLDGVSGDVDIVFTKNQIALSFSGIYITSRIIDGVFPDYRQIMPKESSSEAVVLKQDLMNGLKVTNLFSDKFNRVEFEIDTEKKKLSVESKNSDVGENITEIDAKITGKSIRSGFNQKYILDCFPSLRQDSIVLRFSGEGRPLVVASAGDNTFTYLVMPLTS